jgi:ATP/maltotriose-dependent transcriptional regulator MalT
MRLRSIELRLLGGSRSAAHAQSINRRRFRAVCAVTERNKSMSPASKLVALIPRTEASESKDREVTPFAASPLSRWGAGLVGNHSAQLSSRGNDRLTARERDVLAMISQGCSNKHIARTLEISPETVKSHVKRIFLKLAVSTRTEAVLRAVSLELLS